MIKGSGGGVEVNLMIGQLWLEFSWQQVGFMGFRVESKANLADGPTRADLAILNKLGAIFVPPCLPTWAVDLWGPIADPTAAGI